MPSRDILFGTTLMGEAGFTKQSGIYDDWTLGFDHVSFTSNNEGTSGSLYEDTISLSSNITGIFRQDMKISVDTDPDITEPTYGSEMAAYAKVDNELGGASAGALLTRVIDTNTNGSTSLIVKSTPVNGVSSSNFQDTFDIGLVIDDGVTVYIRADWDFTNDQLIHYWSLDGQVWNAGSTHDVTSYLNKATTWTNLEIFIYCTDEATQDTNVKFHWVDYPLQDIGHTPPAYADIGVPPQEIADDINNTAGSIVVTLEAVICEDSIGIGGYATITYKNKGLTHVSGFRTYEKKNISVHDLEGTLRFRGIIERLSTEDGQMIKLHCSHLSRKLLVQRCNLNPLLMPWDTVRQIGDETSKNKDANYDSAWGTNNYYASLQQLDAYVRKYHITASEVKNEHASATVEERGATFHCWYDDGERYGHLPSTANNADYAACNYSNSQEWNFEFEIIIYKKDGSNWNTVLIDLVFQATTNGVAPSTFPSLEIYNQSTTTWENVWSATDNKDTLYTQQYNLADDIGTITDYMDTQGGVNSSNFLKHNLKLRIKSGSDSSDAAYMRVVMYYLTVTCQYDAPQYPELGQGMLGGVTSNVFNYDNSTPTWGLTEFPLSDGFAFDDLITVTKPLDDQITDVFAAADTDFTISVNVTGIDEVTEIEDLTFVSLGAFLKKISGLKNAIYVINLSTLQITLTSVDNLSAVSESTVITEADGEQGMGSIDYTEDYIAIYTNISIRGKGTYISESSGTSVTEDDGDTDLIVSEPSLVSTKQLRDRLDEIKAIHASARKGVKIRTNPVVNQYALASLKPGLMVPLKLPSASDSNIGNFTTGNDGQMVIRSVTYAISQRTEVYEVRAHKRL